MSLVTETDVLIVGAGPAGLLAALALTRLGINVKIVERRIPGEIAGQADGIQSRTVEVWDSLGIGEKLREVGTAVYQLATYSPNEDQTGIKLVNRALNIPLESARYQLELIVHVKQMENIMKDALSSASVHIDQPCMLSELEVLSEEEQFPIKALCIHFKQHRLAASKIPPHEREKAVSDDFLVDHVETIRARYVIGCDGARSWVRQQCGIVLEGTSTGLAYGVIDFTPVTNFPTARAKNIIQSPSASVLGYVPKPNNTARLYMLSKGTRLIEDLDRSSEEERKATISKVISAEFAPYDMRVEDITWCNTYKVSQRVASRFSHKRRIFIAGDACHIHSPNAGQGVNVSMVDAYNLSWKLAHVIRGWSSEALLDTYELERRPYSLELIEFDKEIELKLSGSDGQDVERYADLWRRQLLFITGHGLQYKSPLIVADHFQDIIAGVTIGRPFPSAEVLRYEDWTTCNMLDIIRFNMKFKLIVFTGNTTQLCTKRICTDFIQRLDEMPRISEVVETFIVLGIKKEDSVAGYIQMGSDIIGTCVFVDDAIASRPGFVHETFKVSNLGAAVLVRPDGHVAMVIPVSSDEVHLLEEYLSRM